MTEKLTGEDLFLKAFKCQSIWFDLLAEKCGYKFETEKDDEYFELVTALIDAGVSDKFLAQNWGVGLKYTPHKVKAHKRTTFCTRRRSQITSDVVGHSRTRKPEKPTVMYNIVGDVVDVNHY